MKKTRCALYSAVFFICAIVPASAGQWKGFDEGMREARAKKLPVIVDFSTDWCGWCKKMDAEVFSRPDIAQRLSKEFITVRLDAESGSFLTYRGKRMTAAQFTALMKVEGFPTLIVFDPQGNVMTQLGGFVEGKYFLMFMDFIKKGCWKKTNFETYLDKGGDCR